MWQHMKAYDVLGKPKPIALRQRVKINCKRCSKLKDRFDDPKFHCRLCVLRSYAESRVVRSPHSQKHGSITLLFNGTHCTRKVVKAVE